jgi:hypothetical protein
MRRAVRKPKEMTVRKLVAIITKMNKSLTRFPGAKDSDKFDADVTSFGQNIRVPDEISR